MAFSLKELCMRQRLRPPFAYVTILRSVCSELQVKNVKIAREGRYICECLEAEDTAKLQLVSLGGVYNISESVFKSWFGVK